MLFLLTSTLADVHIATPEMELPYCTCLIWESSLTSEQTFFISSPGMSGSLFSLCLMFGTKCPMFCVMQVSRTVEERESLLHVLWL